MIYSMTYAVIQIGGKQLWIQPGKFYDVNQLKAKPGQTILLNRVLFLNKDGNIKIGDPCLHQTYVKAKVLRHLKSRKITVFKMKPKKNMKLKRGYRQNLTRLLIQEI